MLRGVVYTMIFIAAAGTVSGNDNEEEEARRRLRELQDFRQHHYPGFISGNNNAPARTPAPPPAVVPDEAMDVADEEEEETVILRDVVRATPLPDFNAPIVLAGDLLTTDTWHATRRRLEPGIEEMRMLMLARALSEEVDAQLDEVLYDFRLIVTMADIQAPTQRDSLALYRDRIARQLNLIADDYRFGRWRQIENTDELLRFSVESFLYLLEESDADRGAEDLIPQFLPPNWRVSPAFEDVGFRQLIMGYNGRRLLAEYDARRASVYTALRRNRPYQDLHTAVEMGELARELARRIHEVPASSETAFRDSALRLDVLAENLHDYLREENRLYALRQLRHMSKTQDEIATYFTLPGR